MLSTRPPGADSTQIGRAANTVPSDSATRSSQWSPAEGVAKEGRPSAGIMNSPDPDVRSSCHSSWTMFRSTLVDSPALTGRNVSQMSPTRTGDGIALILNCARSPWQQITGPSILGLCGRVWRRDSGLNLRHRASTLCTSGSLLRSWSGSAWGGCTSISTIFINRIPPIPFATPSSHRTSTPRTETLGGTARGILNANLRGSFRPIAPLTKSSVVKTSSKPP